jgi:pyruvate-formate lyase-activating enzyme
MYLRAMRSDIHPTAVPFAVVADREGNIVEDTRYLAVGRSGNRMVPLNPDDFIELPEGSEMFFLPGRVPYGYDPDSGRVLLIDDDEVSAVSAFISPAHTQTYLSAFKKASGPVLPLYAYTAVGYLDGKFYTTALRIDPDIRQDVSQFNQHAVQTNVKRMKKKYPGNRMVDHLADNCALTYHCRASQNYFLGRWECPLPVSPACNAECLGCISLQPEEHSVQSSHFRLKFTPTAEEIAAVAIDHLESAPTPIVSYGQGCEGEPLLVWEVVRESILAIRSKTDKGIINMNTNGSRPDAVAKLVEAGLQSIRVSMNSAQEEWYTNYYLPRNYHFNDIKESIKVIRAAGGWASINYFIFPGMSDTEQEFDALCAFIEETGLTMIQWRNFNIDPDFYFKKARLTDPGTALGVRVFINRIKEKYPKLCHGYFNPIAERQQEFLAMY